MNTEQKDAGVLTPSDRTLVVMVRDGDEDAATLLYERYAKRMFGFVRLKLGNKLAATTEPQDIVQSVFRSVFRGVLSGHYEAPPGDTLWNLMAVIAANKLHKQARHNHALCRDTGREVGLENVDEVAAMFSDDSSLASVEASIRETIEFLRPFDREVLTLRIQGYQVNDISELLKRSCRTVERSLHNSREKLAKLLLEN